jgi:uncharacterized protein YdaU (DUF1376 family)
MKKRNGRADHHRPAFQFYPADFLADAAVVAMSMEERGVYITLLCHQWIEGSIPDDPKILARLVHMSPDSFLIVWGQVGDKFKTCDTPGRLKNTRLERERVFMLERSAERIKILETARAKKAAEISRNQGEQDAKTPQEKSPLYDRAMIEPKKPYDRVHHIHSPHPHPHPQATLGINTKLAKNPSTSDEAVTRDADAPELVKKPRGRPRKQATGDHAEFARFWEKLWNETRGCAYVYEAKDGIATAQILKLPGSSLDEAKARAARLLHSSDQFLRSNASVGLLRSKWNQLAANNQHATEPKGYASLRQVLAENRTEVRND